MSWEIWLVSLLWLYLTFGVYWLLQWWLARHLQGLGLLIFGRPGPAASLYFWLLAPGVILHELSHWLMAKLLFVPTGQMALFRPAKNKTRSNKVVLGYVEVYKTDPLRQSFIGLAPLLSGLLVLTLISSLLQFRNGFVDGSHIAETLLHLPGDLWRSLSQPLNWFLLYLAFSISNGMLPSAADRRPWLLGFLLPSALVLMLGVFGILPPFSSEFQQGVLNFLGSLTWVFSFAALINLSLALVVLLLEFLFSRLRRRKVIYGRK
jgi:Zn-dependent protease